MTDTAQFRVYFECLEQAEHFGLEAIRSAIGDDADIQLIRLPSSETQASLANSLSQGLAMKNPDLVISVVKNGEEIPLVWIEISTAVLAEDHIQQRFDSVVAASKINVVFVKIESPRSSPADHGGNTSFDQSEMFRLGRQTLNVYGFHIIWPTTDDGLRAQRSEARASCPVTTLGLEDLLRELVRIVNLHGRLVTSELDESKTLPLWAQHQVERYQLPLVPLVPRRSTRFFREGNDWILKFNRWGHAMDPERGMSWYYRFRTNQRLVGKIHDPEARDRKTAIENFQRATGARVTASSSGYEFNIDISSDLSKSDINRSGLAIFSSCKQFIVCDADGRPLVQFVWSEMQVGSNRNGNLTSQVVTSAVTNEDEVTYATCHAFARHLNLKPHSVSYPGAQGDFALLEGAGRAVRRTYVDLIAVDKIASPSKILLVESKGNRTRANIESDANKMLTWRDTPGRRRILLERLGASDSAHVMVGCAYPGENFLDIPLQREHDLDFEVVVSRSELRYRSIERPSKTIVLELNLTKQFELSRDQLGVS